MGRSGGFKTAKKVLGGGLTLAGPEPRSKPKPAGPPDYLDSFLDNPYNLKPLSPSVGVLSLKDNLVLATSNLLVDFSSPTKKEYRGYVVIEKDKITREVSYKAVTCWGPGGRGHAQGKVYYSGKSLEEARQKIQEMLLKKSGKGYKITKNGYEVNDTNFESESFSKNLPQIL